MTILQGRINYVNANYGCVPREWKVGTCHNSIAAASNSANWFVRVYGWCFIYTVNVESLHLPLVLTQYYVSPVAIQHRLLKTRIKDEGVIFS